MSKESRLPPVFIASKGRPNGRTMQLLKDTMVPHIVFVEPQDREAYADHDQLWVLENDDQGLYATRQQILDYARGMGHEWYWLLDDDITGFFEVVNGRCVRSSALGVLTAASLRFIDERSIGQAGLEYRQYAWAAKRAFKLDSYCDVCVAIRSSVMADYDQRFAMKGDRDFTLQVLSEGYHVMKICRWGFDTVANGSNEGGLYDAYQAGLEREMSELLVSKWPRQAELHVKKDGRPDAKIDWQWFARQRLAREATA